MHEDPETGAAPAAPARAGAGIGTILAATDFSEGAGIAVDRARSLAALHDADVTLIHVIPEGADAEMRRIAQDALERAGAEHGTAATEVATGSVSAAITEAAERIGADLVVVGAHGEHRFKDLFVGSTAATVADTSTVPVLLVNRPGADPYDVVLLAVDLSERSEPTARHAMALTPGARHLLIHVATVIGENLLRLNGAGDEDIERLRRSQADLAVPRARELAETLRPMRTIVEPGRPEQRVPELARELDADLIAVGTKRFAGLRHALLGSVARHTIAQARCDVLIVRTP